MDNLTHTLIGLVAGEAAARTTRAREPGLDPRTRRTLFVTLTTVGGNLPDLDLLYSYFGYAPAKLGYLLQHRGYTHTVLGCLLLAAGLLAATLGWARWRGLKLSRRDRLEMGCVAVFGTLLHLAMDFLNSYGVHPFWPLDNRWRYGDAVFIVEPLYWAAAAGCFFLTGSWAWRLAIGLPLGVAPILGLVTHLVAPVECAAFVVFAVAMLVVGMRSSPRGAAVTSALVCLMVTLMFVGSGSYAEARVDAIASKAFPTEQPVDRVLSPAPMNPLCWEVLLLDTRGDRYSIRRAIFSAAPAVVAASRCPTLLRGRNITAPLSKVEAPSSQEIQWEGEFTMSRTVLGSLAAEHCAAALLMRFARAPFATELADEWVVGDLRFDREPGLGLSEVKLPREGEKCKGSAPWTPPRADLLLPARQGVSVEAPAAHEASTGAARGGGR